MPEYPLIAEIRGIKGDVTLDIDINPLGDVVKAAVVDGPKPLTEAAVRAVMRWKYQAAKRDGESVASSMRVTVHFRMPGR